MMKTMFDWGLQKGKRSPNSYDRYYYIGSSKPKTIPNEQFSKEFENILTKITGKFNILFIGTFTKTNNPNYINDLAKHFNINANLKEKANFILAGDGNLFEQIKADSSEIDNIYLSGWVNNQQIAKLMKQSAFGIIPINSDEEFFPNKAFLYFSGGLPILSSSKGEISQLINKHKLGYNIDLQKPQFIVNKIINCIDNPHILEKMKDNVNKIFREQFDSDIIYKNYADLIERFVLERSSEQNKIKK